MNLALKIITKPMLISHTGLDSRLEQKKFMAKMMKPGLQSKEQAKIVAGLNYLRLFVKATSDK